MTAAPVRPAARGRAPRRPPLADADESVRMSAVDPVQVSLVIPAYNEALRLRGTLDAVEAWARERSSAVEVVVVDDGSDDATADLADAWAEGARARGRVRPVVLREPHRGKGSAVARGVLRAQGAVRVFMDADLAVPMACVEQIVDEISRGIDVAIGSRELPRSRRQDEAWIRHVMGRVFNWVVSRTAVDGFRDTQCGLKAFASDAAEDIFSRVALYPANGRVVRGSRVTAFDVEVLAIARRRSWQTSEIPVEWRHVPLSKVRPLADSFSMVRDVLRVRWNLSTGIYD